MSDICGDRCGQSAASVGTLSTLKVLLITLIITTIIIIRIIVVIITVIMRWFLANWALDRQLGTGAQLSTFSRRTVGPQIYYLIVLVFGVILLLLLMFLSRHQADCGRERVPQEMFLLQEMLGPIGKGKG